MAISAFEWCGITFLHEGSSEYHAQSVDKASGQYNEIITTDRPFYTLAGDYRSWADLKSSETTPIKFYLDFGLHSDPDLALLNSFHTIDITIPEQVNVEIIISFTEVDDTLQTINIDGAQLCTIQRDYDAWSSLFDSTDPSFTQELNIALTNINEMTLSKVFVNSTIGSLVIATNWLECIAEFCGCYIGDFEIQSLLENNPKFVFKNCFNNGNAVKINNFILDQASLKIWAQSVFNDYPDNPMWYCDHFLDENRQPYTHLILRNQNSEDITISDFAFSKCPQTFCVCIDLGYTIYGHSFYECKKIQEVFLDEGTLKEEAFAGISIKDVNSLPSDYNLTEIITASDIKPYSLLSNELTHWAKQIGEEKYLVIAPYIGSATSLVNPMEKELNENFKRQSTADTKQFEIAPYAYSGYNLVSFRSDEYTILNEKCLTTPSSVLEIVDHRENYGDFMDFFDVEDEGITFSEKVTIQKKEFFSSYLQHYDFVSLHLKGISFEDDLFANSANIKQLVITGNGSECVLPLLNYCEQLIDLTLDNINLSVRQIAQPLKNLVLRNISLISWGTFKNETDSSALGSLQNLELSNIGEIEGGAFLGYTHNSDEPYRVVNGWLIHTISEIDEPKNLIIELNNEIKFVENNFDADWMNYTLKVGNDFTGNLPKEGKNAFVNMKVLSCPIDKAADYIIGQSYWLTNIDFTSPVLSVPQNIDLCELYIEQIQFIGLTALPQLQNIGTVISLAFDKMNLYGEDMSLSHLLGTAYLPREKIQVRLWGSEYDEYFGHSCVGKIEFQFEADDELEPWEGMFSSFPSLQEVDDTSGVLTCENGAIYDETVLYYLSANYSGKTVKIPEGITRIGKEAFINYHHTNTSDDALREVYIPTTLTGIGEDAFLTNYTVLNEEGAGVYIDSLEHWCDINLAGSTSNPLRCFQNLWIGDKKLITLNIPSSKKDIAPHQFFNCRSLKEINVPRGGATFGYGAFRNATNLEKISAYNTLTLDKLSLSVISSAATVAEDEISLVAAAEPKLSIYLYEGAKIARTSENEGVGSEFSGRENKYAFYRMIDGNNDYIVGNLEYFSINTYAPDGTITNRKLDITFYDLNDETVEWDTRTGIVTATNRLGERRAIRTSGNTCFELKPNEELIVEGKVIRPYWYY